jgi:hypothetical protein
MSSSNLPNEVFEIVPPPELGKRYGYELKYKGKFLHPEIVKETGDGFNIDISPEDFLDFDSAFVPEDFCFLLFLPQHKCMDLMDIVRFTRKGNEIKFNYSFAILDNPPPDIYLNPSKLIELFYELAGEKGYDVQYCGMQEYAASIEVNFPTNGNLYQHYKKHLDVFESLMAQAADEMIKRILGK